MSRVQTRESVSISVIYAARLELYVRNGGGQTKSGVVEGLLERLFEEAHVPELDRRTAIALVQRRKQERRDKARGYALEK